MLHGWKIIVKWFHWNWCYSVILDVCWSIIQCTGECTVHLKTVSSDTSTILWRSPKSCSVCYKSSQDELLFPYLLSLTRSRNVIATEQLISFSSISLASSLLTLPCCFIIVGGICSLCKAGLSHTLEQVASLCCEGVVAENSLLWKFVRFLCVSLFMSLMKTSHFFLLSFLFSPKKSAKNLWYLASKWKWNFRNS